MIDYAAERAAIGRYQDADQRLQDVGWHLARANAAFCPRVVPSIGLQLQDMASYGVPAIARAAWRMGWRFRSRSSSLRLITSTTRSARNSRAAIS